VFAALLGAVLLGAALCACTSSAGTSTQTRPSLAAVRALLASYGSAVREHDRAALLGDLDPAGVAAAFRAQQRSDYASLVRLPLRVWSYRIVGEIHDQAAVSSAARRYGAPVRLVHVALSYALSDVDVLASVHDEYLVFVRRGSHTYIAGDDALSSTNEPSWTGPWRYGPLTAVTGARSLVLGRPGTEPVLRALADQVDAVIPAVTRVWGTGWSQRVAVIVPATDAEFTALTGVGIRDVSAAAVTEGVDPGSGRPYGQRLVLNPAQLNRLAPLGRRIVLTHEITHLASAADTPDITPRWLAEGFADTVANHDTGQSVATAAAELRTAVRAGQVPAALPADEAFAATGPALARVYEQSWLACRLIADRVGLPGLVRFYRAVGTALAPRAEAVAAAFRGVLHETEAQFTAQWRAYLTSQLR
jgi:hypothetical protein